VRTVEFGTNYTWHMAILLNLEEDQEKFGTYNRKFLKINMLHRTVLYSSSTSPNLRGQKLKTAWVLASSTSAKVIAVVCLSGWDVLLTSCRSLRSIGPPFRGFLVWRCAFCSEWPAHWLHNFYSSWCDCQSHLAVSQETWVRNGRWILLYSCP
jgi:hypothetical protein